MSLDRRGDVISERFISPEEEEMLSVRDESHQKEDVVNLISAVQEILLVRG